MATTRDLSEDVAYVTLVESPACHFCADAQQVLAELAARYPLVVETVDIGTPMGLFLMQEHRATMSPLVLLGGQFFSNGRLPRRKLTERLHERFGEPAGTRTV